MSRQNQKHPHLERPSEQQLADALAEGLPNIRDLYLAVHRLVLETLPDVAYSVDLKDGATGYGARQYGYGGWGMAALAPAARWVSLAFLSGANLPDAEGLLEGSGKLVRHVKVRSLDELEQRRAAIRELITAASSINA